MASELEYATALIDRPASRTILETGDPEGIRVAIVANGPALQAGLRAMLESDPGFVVIDGLNEASETGPDIILLDASLTRLLDEVVRPSWPDARLVLVGVPGNEDGLSWRDSAAGLVSARLTAEQLVAAVRAVAAGLQVFDPELDESAGFVGSRQPSQPPDDPVALTPRERQVLELVARGYPNKSIAYELGITEHTAKFHVGSLLSKFHAASRAEIVTNATRSGALTF